MMNTDGCLLKITVITFIDIHKFLRVAVCQREPTALHLDHNAVSFLKSMRNIGQFEFYSFYFIGFKCYGCGKTIAKTAAHDFTAHQKLVTAHGIIAADIAAAVRL